MLKFALATRSAATSRLPDPATDAANRSPSARSMRISPDPASDASVRRGSVTVYVAGLRRAPIEVAAELAARTDLQPLAIDDNFHFVERFGGPDRTHRRRSAYTDDDQVRACRRDFVKRADAVAALDRGRLRGERRAAARRERDGHHDGPESAH